MRKHCHSWIIVPCLLFSAYSYSYEVDTHERLSEAAFSASRLGTDNTTLSNMGIDAAQELPDSKGVPRTPAQLMMRGANFEDNLSLYRPINHFFNPLNSSALTGVPGNHPSPDWALEDTGSIGLQDFSYRDARNYFYKALTLPDRTEREKNAGLTFQTIGMVIHHIQDMAQPQHVRNDAHLDLGGYFPGIENPSLYEKFTNNNRGMLPYGGYPAVYSDSAPTSFNQPRYFWEKPTGEGLAQFTNSNFVSAGTNFDNPGMFNFPLFDPARRIDMNIGDLCATAVPACPQGLAGSMTFYGNTVEDRYTGQATLNPLASTESLFSADLEQRLNKKVFTLNRFNFAVAHGFLIPRAVGYSAGLINYFFRGKIALVESQDHPGFYTIKNLFSEDMNGTFKLFYDDAGDVRHEVPGAEWKLQIPANGESGLITLPLPVSASLPQPKSTDKLMLAFTGSMGQEMSGAIAGKVVACTDSSSVVGAGGQTKITPIAPLDLIAKHKAGQTFTPLVIEGTVRLARPSQGALNTQFVWMYQLRNPPNPDWDGKWALGTGSWGGLWDYTNGAIILGDSPDIGEFVDIINAYLASTGFLGAVCEECCSTSYPFGDIGQALMVVRYWYDKKKYDALAGCTGGLFAFKSEADAALWLSENLAK